MSATTSAPLPLTTIFTPPSACLNDLWAAISAGYTWMNLGPINTTKCLPSGWAPSTYFSPGICPSGYVIAKTLEIRSGTMTETVATCCPVYVNPASIPFKAESRSLYTSRAASNTYSLRASATTTELWWTTEVCAWQPPTNVITSYSYTHTGTDGQETVRTGSMTSPGSINAYGVEIRWQSTDFITPPATAAVTTTQAAPGAPQTSTGSSSGLQTGAKVGIGVGVSAGVVLATVLVLGVFWLRRRRRQQLSPVAMQDPSGNDVYDGQPAELPATRQKPFTYGKAELSADPARTARTSHQIEAFELDGQTSR